MRSIVCRVCKDEGTAWPSANDIDDTSDKFGGDPGEVDINANGRGSLEGKSVSTFANLLSHSILCLTRAASRARWGRAWVKVRSEIIRAYDYTRRLQRQSLSAYFYPCSECDLAEFLGGVRTRRRTRSCTLPVYHHSSRATKLKCLSALRFSSSRAYCSLLPLSTCTSKPAKTERACGLLWNMVLSLWLSPQNFHHASDIPASSRREGDMDEGVCLGEYHARAFAKACEVRHGVVDWYTFTGLRKVRRSDLHLDKYVNRL